ncbi:MAG: hypothetical protein HY721_01295 [Planctomycetes bacterium]|nr:hypothetical protein [Planctomycetota bacterium]
MVTPTPSISWILAVLLGQAVPAPTPAPAPAPPIQPAQPTAQPQQAPQPQPPQPPQQPQSPQPPQPQPQPAPAEQPPAPAAREADREADRVADLHAAIGFTASPGTFLMALEGSFPLTRAFSLGPLVQLGVADDPVVVAPTINFRWAFFLPPPDLDRLRPFAQWGLGAAYLHDDRRRRDDDDAGFLANAGGGFEYDLTERVALGSSVLFNVMPDRVLGERFFFSWQLAQATFRF